MTITGKRHPVPFDILGGVRRRGQAAGGAREPRLRRRLVAGSVPAHPGPRALPPGQRLLHPARAFHRPGGQDQHRRPTPRSAASADRRPCWSSRRSWTAWRARSACRPSGCARANLYRGSGETNTTHYGQEIGDNRLQGMWKQVQAQADFEARRRTVDEWNARHDRVKRGLARHGGEVRDLLYPRRVQPGRRARRDLPGRHRAGEPRRHRDGPGPAHEDPRRGDAGAGAARRPASG